MKEYYEELERLRRDRKALRVERERSTDLEPREIAMLDRWDQRIAENMRVIEGLIRAVEKLNNEAERLKRGGETR